MKDSKLYFENEDSEECYQLKYHLNDARVESKQEITLLEAIPDDRNPDFIYCKHYGKVGERSECKKSQCSFYSSKSGRGKCKNRGKLYEHGEAVTFRVNPLQRTVPIN